MVNVLFPPPPVSFSTTFPGTENPLSESGAWITGVNAGRTSARKIPGLACGTMVSFDGTNFTDSVACLATWKGNNQRITATVGNNGAGSLAVEVELAFRVVLTSGTNTGIELDLVNASKELNLVQWDGPNNTFDIASGFPITTNVSMADGDVWDATLIGTILNATCNGNAVITNLDISGVFSSGLLATAGAPGMGFWNETGVAGNQTKLGWKSFTATAL